MSGMKERQRRRRSKKRARQYRHSMLAVCAVLVFLVAALSVNAFQLRAKAQEYQIQETELAEQIEEEKGRAAQIDDLEAYVGTDELCRRDRKRKVWPCP